jgi:phage baseplate assembly protein W
MSMVTSGPNPVTEIKTPFMVDPSTGLIGTMSDPVQIAIQHIMAICFTAPGERLMLPDYGVGISNLLFEGASEMEFQSVATIAQQQLSQTDGLYYDVQVTIQASPSNPGTFTFQVQFQIYSDPQVHYAVFDFQGNLIGES